MGLMAHAQRIPAPSSVPRPRFCPRRDCPAHRLAPGERFRCHRRGSRINAKRGDTVVVYYCLHGHHYFSSSAFTNDYWHHHTGLLPAVFRGLCEGQSGRQLARTLGVPQGTIARRERRLARQALLILLRQQRGLEGRLQEDVVLDGLRTFAGSQYEPLDLNTLVTARSGFVLDLAAAPLRRSGSMSEQQRRRRAERDERLGRPDPKIRRTVTRRSLRLLLRLVPHGRTVGLRTDEERDYARALADLGHPPALAHRTVSSRRRRDTSNPLWRVNLLHSKMRHGLKSHARETLGFHKRLTGLLDRALLFVIWNNCTKGISERSARRARITPAMLLGLADRPLDGHDLFAERLFPDREGLPEAWRAVYEGRIVARPREPMTRRVPRFAY